MSTHKNISWNICGIISIIASITVIYVLFLTKPSLSGVWGGFRIIIPLVGVLLALRTKIIKILAIGLLVISVLSASVYSLSFVRISFSNPSNSMTLTPKNGKEIAPQENIETENHITPEQLEDEIQTKPEKYFTPTYDPEHAINIFLTKQPNIDSIDNYIEKQQILYDTVKNRAELDMGTIENDNFHKLNTNKTYTDLIRNANKNEDLLRISGKSIDLYNEIISAREQAFNIGKTRALALLLARDYYNFGTYLNILGDKQGAYSYYTRSIEYYTIVNKLTVADGDYSTNQREVSYITGQVYHSIGDIQYLEQETRTDAYLMALTYLKLSLWNMNDNFISYYYCGMLEHKLSIIAENNKSALLTSANNYYENCLAYPMDKSMRIGLCKFLYQINSKLINYNETIDQKAKNVLNSKYRNNMQNMLETIQRLQNTN